MAKFAKGDPVLITGGRHDGKTGTVEQTRPPGWSTVYVHLDGDIAGAVAIEEDHLEHDKGGPKNPDGLDGTLLAPETPQEAAGGPVGSEPVYRITAGRYEGCMATPAPTTEQNFKHPEHLLMVLDQTGRRVSIARSALEPVPAVRAPGTGFIPGDRVAVKASPHIKGTVEYCEPGEDGMIGTLMDETAPTETRWRRDQLVVIAPSETKKLTKFGPGDLVTVVGVGKHKGRHGTVSGASMNPARVWVSFEQPGHAPDSHGFNPLELVLERSSGTPWYVENPEAFAEIFRTAPLPKENKKMQEPKEPDWKAGDRAVVLKDDSPRLIQCHGEVVDHNTFAQRIELKLDDGRGTYRFAYGQLAREVTKVPLYTVKELAEISAMLGGISMQEIEAAAARAGKDITARSRGFSIRQWRSLLEPMTTLQAELDRIAQEESK